MADESHQDEACVGAATDAGLEPLACVSCRSRKLKCDRTKPACARCLKVAGECVYPESRRKPTFKRRNVKELEARLAQVEGLLKDINSKDNADHVSPHSDVQDINIEQFAFTSASETPNLGNDAPAASMPNFDPTEFFAPDRDQTQPGNQLIDLGMSEALPPYEVMEELNNIFFMTAYHFVPVVHAARYYEAFYGGPLRRPPMCLQYAVMTLAAVGHPKYDTYADVFYKRARQYIQADEMKGQGEHFITLAHAQSWVLIATYEARVMLFTRASMSCSRSVRICQMMGLDRIDGGPNDLPPALGPATTWSELEERRRVFWGAFTIDCHASIATGWPCLINQDDIMTRLPCSEPAFSSGMKEETAFLHEVFRGASFAGFAGTVVVCSIYRSILQHVHRPKPDDNPEDMMHGGFWKRHRELDNNLSSIFMFLPEKFRLPQNQRDPTAIHTNLNLHASVICLHHAAVEMAEKHNHPTSLLETSKSRLRASAEEIVAILKLTAHQTGIFKSPLCAISMYCASTVYIYMAKHQDLSHLDISNLEVIIHSMQAIGRTHQITNAFLQQACLDIERNGLSSRIRFPALANYREWFGDTASNIPLLARSSISRHSNISPILPGKLPLGNPIGSEPPEPMPRGTNALVKSLINSECFQPMLGAVTRNVAPINSPAVNVDAAADSFHGSKRKRMSASPAPEMNTNYSTQPITNGNYMAPPMTGANWRFGQQQPQQHQQQTINENGPFTMNLPDRSGSSNASSPAYRSAASGSASHGGNGGGTGTDTYSGSSQPSPSTGLGNTPEENRIDLRSLQDRISGPIWADNDAFMAQIAESLVNGELPGGVGSSWNFLTGDLPAWQTDPSL